MPTKKKTSTTKRKIKAKTTPVSDYIKNVKQTSEDRMLEKIEDYVDKNWAETAQKIAEKRSNRPTRHYKKAELEAMISRVSIENNSSSVRKDNNKWLVYIVYSIIVIAVILFIMKCIIWNTPQIS